MESIITGTKTTSRFGMAVSINQRYQQDRSETWKALIDLMTRTKAGWSALCCMWHTSIVPVIPSSPHVFTISQQWLAVVRNLSSCSGLSSASPISHNLFSVLSTEVLFGGHHALDLTRILDWTATGLLPRSQRTLPTLCGKDFIFVLKRSFTKPLIHMNNGFDFVNKCINFSIIVGFIEHRWWPISGSLFAPIWRTGCIWTCSRAKRCNRAVVY